MSLNATLIVAVHYTKSDFQATSQLYTFFATSVANRL